MSTDQAVDISDVTARRDAERERRIAAARANRKPSAMAIAMADTGGNGAPPTLDDFGTIKVLGELLYGPRWQSDVATDLGIAPRQLRRWVAGESKPTKEQAGLLRFLARRRAKAILRLVDGI